MFESDTEKLLKECDAGIKMGIASLEDVMSASYDPNLERRIKSGKKEHEELRVRTEDRLNHIGCAGKDPAPMAKLMSHMKTKLVTAYDPGDKAVARLVSDGCDMGVKSLSRYLDKYAAADADSKALAGDIIAAERQLTADMKRFR